MVARVRSSSVFGKYRKHDAGHQSDGPETVPVDPRSNDPDECLVGAVGVISVMKIVDKGVALTEPHRINMKIKEGHQYPGISIGLPIPLPNGMFSTRVVGILPRDGRNFVYTHPTKSPRDCSRSFSGCSCYVLVHRG